MKKLLLLLLIGITFSCQEKKPIPKPAAQLPKISGPFYRLKQKVYVHALEGLSLRKSPDPKALKIGLAQYGSALEIVAMPEPKDHYVAENSGAFQLEGHWVKVRNAENKEAYVFDGYLTPFPILVEQMKEDLADLEWFYQDISKFKGERQITAPDEKKGIVEGYKQRYADGGEFEYILYNGGVTQYLRVPATTLSLQQALVSLRSFYFSNAKKLKTEWDNKNKVVRVSDEESAYEWLEFGATGTQIIVSYHSAD